ncbi:hypothetical protein [Corynebacterium sp. HMSC28B08]|uniref:hypothetical protein n=1 Tax=Corynebacterium TaxID=1716 RepID=UPI001FEF4B00|nr:hypothetical protein [Corynebacterium sp. HMSC28B08]
MTDAKIIDAYDHAYNVAQAVGAANREPELPPTRDRMTMARRVRGYVLSNGRKKTGTTLGSNGSATAQERKALATMGRKGGQKAAERWNDRNSEYARTELAKLKKANAKRTLSGGLLEAKVKAAILEARTQEVADPSTKELAETLGVSVRRVQQVRKALGMTGRQGRPKKAKRRKQYTVPLPPLRGSLLILDIAVRRVVVGRGRNVAQPVMDSSPRKLWSATLKFPKPLTPSRSLSG